MRDIDSREYRRIRRYKLLRPVPDTRRTDADRPSVPIAKP